MNLNMKAITIYQTNDGCRFDNKEKATKYEELCDRCNEIESRLVNIGRELQYNEYIQHDVDAVKQAFCDFMDLVAKELPCYSKMAKECADGTRHISHICGIICSNFGKCLVYLIIRFCNIDFSNGREFKDSYVKENQEEATIKVN